MSNPREERREQQAAWEARLVAQKAKYEKDYANPPRAALFPSGRVSVKKNWYETWHETWNEGWERLSKHRERMQERQRTRDQIARKAANYSKMAARIAAHQHTTPLAVLRGFDEGTKEKKGAKETAADARRGYDRAVLRAEFIAERAKLHRSAARAYPEGSPDRRRHEALAAQYSEARGDPGLPDKESDNAAYALREAIEDRQALLQATSEAHERERLAQPAPDFTDAPARLQQSPEAENPTPSTSADEPSVPDFGEALARLQQSPEAENPSAPAAEPAPAPADALDLEPAAQADDLVPAVEPAAPAALDVQPSAQAVDVEPSAPSSATPSTPAPEPEPAPLVFDPPPPAPATPMLIRCATPSPSVGIGIGRDIER